MAPVVKRRAWLVVQPHVCGLHDDKGFGTPPMVEPLPPEACLDAAQARLAELRLSWWMPGATIPHTTVAGAWVVVGSALERIEGWSMLQPVRAWTRRYAARVAPSIGFGAEFSWRFATELGLP